MQVLAAFVICVPGDGALCSHHHKNGPAVHDLNIMKLNHILTGIISGGVFLKLHSHLF